MLKKNNRRLGLGLIWSMVVLMTMCAFASLAIDYGRVTMAKTELLRAADAAARAAVTKIANGETVARQYAKDTAKLNKCDAQDVLLNSTDIEIGYWDGSTFTPMPGASAVNGNAARVKATRTIALAFAKAVGKNSVDIHEEAIAMISPPYPGYIGIKLTRCFNTTVFDSYDSSKGEYSSSNQGNKGVLIGVKDLWLHDNCTVKGEAHWGPTGALTKDSGASCSPGPLTMKPWTQNYPPVVLGSVPTINDNNKITKFLSGTSFKMKDNSGEITFPGGTYYFTSLDIGHSCTVIFSGPTTIYLNGKASINGNLRHSSFRPYFLNIKIANGGGAHIEDGRTYAYIYAPEGDVHSHKKGETFGSVISSLLCWRQEAKGHYDESGGPGGNVVSVK